MRKNLLLLFALLTIQISAIGQITSAATGQWSATTTWVGGVVPTSTDDVVIAAGHTVTQGTATMINSLTINATGQLNITSSITFTLNGDLNNSGSISITGQLKIAGNFTNQIGGTITGAFGAHLRPAGASIINNGTINMSNTGTFGPEPADNVNVAQTISGTGTFSIHTLTVSNQNAAGITMAVPLTVTRVTLFSPGKLFLGNNNLTVHIGFNSIGNTTSYIVTNGTGRVRWATTEPINLGNGVTIPVGNSTHNPIGISNNLELHTFSVSVKDNLTNAAYGPAIVNAEWDIQDETGGAVSVDITPFWYATDEDASFTRTNCYVSRYNGTNWEQVSSTGEASAAAGLWKTTAMDVNSFSPFGVGSFCALIVTPVVSDQPDQTLCNNGSFTMTQSAPSVGTGVWTLESGSATITTPGSPTTTVTGVLPGTSAVVKWTVTNGSCTAFDLVVVTNEGFDVDGDGYATCQGDCDDNNAAVNPGATEVCNGIDDNCNGQIDEGFDVDGDGYTTCEGDCDDNNAAINPGATEVCNGIDDNCDGQIDEGAQPVTWYQDFDSDGFGNPSVSQSSCTQPTGYVLNNTDCNDGNAAVNPGATEVCNGIDDDCDGQIDEGFDVDGDGFTTCEGDCDDNNAAINPGATEVCNGIDDDCDGQIDEAVQLTFYRDLDGDGYGNASITTQACSAPAGYVSDNTDCNDNNAAVHPGATEVCNGIDDDCDGQIDEDFDVDGDGYTTCEGDCDDNNALINPGVTEICNNIDDDCDGQIDEGFDVDGDGYTTCEGDCDDNNALVNPVATEVCGNGIDDDCNGQVDEECSSNITINIADISVLESAGSALVPVTLSASSSSIITVKYKTSNGTAKHPKDYKSTMGTLTFLPGETSNNISIPIIADELTEGDENFFVALNRPVNATISDGNATVTITETASPIRTKNNYITESQNKEEIKLIVINPQHKQEFLRFYGLPLGSFDVLLTDVNGRTVASLKNYRNNWGMSNLKPGIYFYKVSLNEKNNSGKYYSGRLLITE